MNYHAAWCRYRELQTDVVRLLVEEVDPRRPHVREEAAVDVDDIFEPVCPRCLEPISDDLETTFQELYVYDDPDRRNPDEEDDEVSMLEDDLLDLEPLLRDAVVLALPFQPLCSEDCPGLCPDCGFRLADDPDHGHEAPVDPRWAKLTELEQHPERPE